MEPTFTEQERPTFARAMANVAACDGRVTEDERCELENLIGGIGLSPSNPKVFDLVTRPASASNAVRQPRRPVGRPDRRAADDLAAAHQGSLLPGVSPGARSLRGSGALGFGAVGFVRGSLRGTPGASTRGGWATCTSLASPSGV